MEQSKRGGYKAVAFDGEDDSSLPVAVPEDSVVLASVPIDGLRLRAVASNGAYFRNDSDVVEVFDYDTQALESNRVTVKFLPFIIFNCVCGGMVYGSFLRLCLGRSEGSHRFLLFPFLVALLIGFNSPWLRRHLMCNISQSCHTAVTPQGLLHVQPREALNNNIGGTMLIPFSEIRCITVSCDRQPRMVPLSRVQIETFSIDGMEYVKSGFPTFEKGSPANSDSNETVPLARLDLVGLVDPFQVKKLLIAMKDQKRDETARRAKAALQEEDTATTELRELRDELQNQIEMIESIKPRGEP
jgi:hypothetical protein